jgi:hypothetical protein
MYTGDCQFTFKTQTTPQVHDPSGAEITTYTVVADDTCCMIKQQSKRPVFTPNRACIPTWDTQPIISHDIILYAQKKSVLSQFDHPYYS